MKHSPGPWHVHMGHLIKCDVGLVIADVEKNPSHIIKTARIANAHLIAAAPELLEAARMMADLVDDLLVQAGANYADELAAARAAIAKAEGGAA